MLKILTILLSAAWRSDDFEARQAATDVMLAIESRMDTGSVVLPIWHDAERRGDHELRARATEIIEHVPEFRDVFDLLPADESARAIWQAGVGKAGTRTWMYQTGHSTGDLWKLQRKPRLMERP